MNLHLHKVTAIIFFMLCILNVTHAQTLDLTVTGKPLTRTVYRPGEVFTAGFDYCNTGTGTAPSASMGYYLSVDSILSADDIRIKTGSVPSVPSGSCRFSKSGVSIPEFFEAGEYLLIYKIDDQNLIEETNESNNLSIQSIRIEVPLDVTLNDVRHEDSACLDCEVWVSFNAINDSPVTAPAHEVSYFLSSDSIYDNTDVFLLKEEVPVIAANSAVDIIAHPVIPLNTPIGDYFLMIVIDSNNDLEEVNEANNIIYSIISVVPPLVDLIPVSAHINSDSVHSNGFSSLTCRISNIGSEYTSGCVLTIYISQDSVLDAQKMAEGYIDYFLPRSEVEETINIFLGDRVGNYYLIVRVDSDSRVAESNENNNVLYLPIQILPPQIDLAISEVELERDTIVNGDSLRVSFIEQNVGYPDALYHEVGLYLSTDTILSAFDQMLWQTVIYRINVGENKIFTTEVTINAPNPGDYYLIFATNRYNRVREANRDNNFYVRKVMIKEPLGGQAMEGSALISFSNVYPNPSQGIFNIDTEAGQWQNAVFEIVSVKDSKVVASGKLTGEQTSVSLGSSTGLYLLKIKRGDSVATQRLIVR